jgi:Protein of unknown function (DUF2842)
MKERTRKFFGTIGTVTYLVCYALMAMAVGGIFAVGRGVLVELATFIVLGLLWIPGAMVIIRWMSKPDDLEER